MHLVDRVQLGVVVVAQAPRLVVDHGLELRQPLRHRQDLVDLLLVLDRGEAHLGMREHVGQLVGHRVGIDRHRDDAERLRRHHRGIEPAAGWRRRSRWCRRAARPGDAGRPHRRAPRRAAAPRSSVCQMPRSLCRIAGRSPKLRALRISNFGKVSALGGTLGSPRLPPNRPRNRDARRGMFPSPAAPAAGPRVDKNGPARTGQASAVPHLTKG